MDILTDIAYTILDYSPESLLLYVIAAAIVGLVRRVRRGRLPPSTRGMPYPTRIVTRDELPRVLGQYRKPMLDEFARQSKTAIIEPLSADRADDGL